MLLTLYPEVKENIAEIVMMGGSLAREIQIQVPNLIRMSIHIFAQIVFQSGVPLTMVGLDVTSQAVLTNHEVTAIRALGRVGEMFYGLFRHYRGGSLTTGLKMHDVCAIAYLTSPELFETTETFIEVALEGRCGSYCCGFKMKYHKNTNAVACIDVNVEAFSKMGCRKMKAVN